jgi:hypothetical protein
VAIITLRLGDVMKDGRVSDTVYSNNQDIVKIMTTIIATMKDFLKENPTAKLVFTGSTDDRTSFYKRILSRHYQTLSAQYTITGLAEDESGIPVEMEFDPGKEDN